MTAAKFPALADAVAIVGQLWWRSETNYLTGIRVQLVTVVHEASR
jgi:RPA family protein